MKRKIDPRVGDMVELVYTNDELTKLKKGDRGVITRIEGARGDRVFFINWENGQVLALLEEIDEFKIIKKAR
ncbi:MAG: DUF4314 domain-containing protein [Candidatus Thermoplasmatota archaeon]